MATTDPTNTNTAPANGAPTRPMNAITPATADHDGAISAFASASNFEAAQRMAKALSCSSLMPKDYNNNIPNCLIAMEMASRIGASVLMVAQSLDIIHGRPSWRSSFLIATVNASKRFTPLRFRWSGKAGTDDYGCRAVAKDRSDGEECIGALITIGMAKAEGWFTKNGSKWKTMPEQMLMYRSAAFWARVYAPELSMGINTAEEIIDVQGYDVTDAPTKGFTPGSARALEDELLGERPPVTFDGAGKSDSEPYDPATGEIVEAPKPAKSQPKAERMREPGED